MTCDQWAREVAEDVVRVIEDDGPQWDEDTIAEAIERYEQDDVAASLMDDVMRRLISCARSGGECAGEASCLLDELWSIGIGQEVDG